MDVRDHILKALLTPDTDARFNRSYLPAEIMRRAGCQPHEVWEALWGLVGDGLIYLDPEGQQQDNWRWKLSALGIKACTGGPWEPRDPQGYLTRLKDRIPDLDHVAMRYLREALQAFNARCYLASSVMLGVAAEQVFDGLADSVVAALGTSAQNLRKAIENPKMSQYSRFLELRKRLEPLRPELPDDLGDTLTLDAVANLLRITRNEAGHPTGREIDEDTAYTHLQMAAGFLEKMTLLRLHFEAQTAGPI